MSLYLFFTSFHGPSGIEPDCLYMVIMKSKSMSPTPELGIL
ncbi:MAG: hypothetical protein OEW93_10735 [Candidatus Bathyarchaeota archaeon]|nr:hypothetical protein [Candidatus Bathyarchaeota archaeon]